MSKAKQKKYSLYCYYLFIHFILFVFFYISNHKKKVTKFMIAAELNTRITTNISENKRKKIVEVKLEVKKTVDRFLSKDTDVHLLCSICKNCEGDNIDNLKSRR